MDRRLFPGPVLPVLLMLPLAVAASPSASVDGTADARAWRDVSARMLDGPSLASPLPMAARDRLAAIRRDAFALPAPKAATMGRVRVIGIEGDVAIDPDARRLDLVLRQTVRFLEDGTNSFRLVSFLPIASIEDGDGAPIEWTDSDGGYYHLATIPLPEARNAGDTMDYVVRLGGVPDCSMSGPISVNLCAWGTVVYIAGDLFAPSGTDRDFATADLRITLPAGYVVAATGVTESVTPAADGREVHRIVQDFPTDSRSFGIAPYVQAVIPRGDGAVRTFTMGTDARVQAGVPEVLTDMKSVLDYYSTRIGAFLYPKMDACQVTNDAGAAFGWPALLWIPDGMFRRGGSSRTALFAHELGHQWFPDQIQNDDPFAAWLSEGFAEYLSTEYMGTIEGADYPAAIYNYYGDLYQYFISDSSDYGLSSLASGSVSDSGVYQIVTYYKGATICHVLEQFVGTDAWNRALQAMHADLAGREAYYDTDGLKSYLEVASGKDLTDVFLSYVRKKGYPIYTVDVLRSTSESGTPKATVRIRRASSTKNNAFTLPVQIGLVTDAGETVQEVLVDADDLSFTFDLDGRLARVRFDPSRKLLKQVRPGLDGDYDLSGEVDGIDLLYVAWSQGGSLYGYSTNFVAAADFDRNAMVDGSDLATVTDSFGRTSDGGAP